ncbi:MAG: hypothetical protein KA817_08750 [Flavobacteriales bacterium]|jgi:GLPGLI family protein|nr:hypothetical protein [Flavobacteriales bacterium]
MNNPVRSTLTVLVLGTLLNSCGTGLLDQRLTEGVIEYALSFPDYDPNGIMAGMLPERTTLTFKEDKQVAELSAGMGVFRTTMVTDNTNQALDYHLSLMSKKIVAHMLPNDLELFSPSTSKPTILYTSDVDTIAGYPCKKAVAVYDDLDQVECELWYTDRIKMSNPNWFGPFAEVPGVLMRYDVVQYGMRMRLNALSVTPGEVDPAKFDTKKEFEQVPAEVLHHELAEVLGTFAM